MFKSSVDPLKSSFTMTDMFYVSVLLDTSQEIVPIEVNFEEIFYDLVQIQTIEPVCRNSEVILNMYNEEVIYNIAGAVVRSTKGLFLYKTTIKIEELPTKLFNELINMMKEIVGEVKET